MKDERYYSAYLAHHHISRRGLFRALMGGGQKAKAESQKALLKKGLARPPFAVAEPLFLKQCNGCSDCVSACPYGLIVLKDNKATIDIDFSACDLCGDCAKACKTGALVLNVLPDTGLRPVFDFSCLRQHQQHCVFCEMACTAEAIAFDIASKKMQVDQDKCTGCGECKIACPQNYIRLTLSSV